MPQALASGPFSSSDGLSLYGEHYPAVAPARGNVLIMHGYADHGGRYREVARRLASLGFNVLAMDYRGHGRAAGQRGHCEKFDEFLGDFAQGTKQFPSDGKPLVVVAHSHGCLIALRGLCEPGRIPGISAAVLSSPFLGLAMKVSPLKLLVAKVASRAMPTLALPNGVDPSVISHDHTVVEARRVDGLCHDVATSRWFAEATAAQAYVSDNAARISVPTLWLVAQDDRIANAKVTQLVFEHAGGDKKLCLYPGFFHEVFNEVERARVFSEMEAWLSSRFPAP